MALPESQAAFVTQEPQAHLVLRTANYPASLAGCFLASQARLLRVEPTAY